MRYRVTELIRLIKHKRRLFCGLLIAASIGIAFCLMSFFNLFYGLQLIITDKLFQAAAKNDDIEPVKDIVIVAIDDKSLEELGHFSLWPRSYHTRVINALSQAGARVIVFDMLFAESAQGDEELALAIKNAGNVILPSVYNIVPDNSDAAGQKLSILNTIRPLGILENSAAAIGHAVVFPDTDGVIRRLPVLIENNGRYEPSLDLAAIATYLRRPKVIETPIENGRLAFAGRSIPLDASDCMLIKYTDTEAVSLHFTEVPYIDLLNNISSVDTFQDKIVVIGATATGIGDKFWTPMGRVMNGVELHTSAIQTILSGSFLRVAPPIADILSIMLFSLLCGLVALRLRVLWATLSTVFLCGVYFMLASFLFDRGLILNILHPNIAAAATFIGVNIYNAVYERSEKNAITKTFGRYISPPVVKKILTALEEDNLKLGGEAHEITVLFADARHFTSIAENIRSEEVFDLLNKYMSLIIDSVLKYDGIVNKFGGDSILAVWNAPLASGEHALLATRAAIDAQQAIHRLNEATDYFLTAEFGMGINTGIAMVGNMGSKDRLEYTVIGDAVNIAARLAGAAPGGKIWLGVDTYLMVEDYITARRIDPLIIKGRHEPVLAYEIADVPHLQTVDAGYFKNFIK